MGKPDLTKEKAAELFLLGIKAARHPKFTVKGYLKDQQGLSEEEAALVIAGPKEEEQKKGWFKSVCEFLNISF